MDDVTEESYASKPPTDRDRQLDIPLSTLGIDDFDAEAIAKLLHRYSNLQGDPC